MSEMHPPEVFSDDALLDALAAGAASDGSRVATVLGAWRAELDAAELAAPTAPDSEPVLEPLPPPIWEPADEPVAAPPPARGRHRQPRRRTLAVIAAVAALFAGTGIAAAALSGPNGPLGALNRVLFGYEPPHRDVTATRVTALLDAATKRIADARVVGALMPRERMRIRLILYRASRLLDADPAAPAGLHARIARLERALAGLPTLSPPPGSLPPSREPSAPPTVTPSAVPSTPTAASSSSPSVAPSASVSPTPTASSSPVSAAPSPTPSSSPSQPVFSSAAPPPPASASAGRGSKAAPRPTNPHKRTRPPAASPPPPHRGRPTGGAAGAHTAPRGRAIGHGRHHPGRALGHGRHHPGRDGSGRDRAPALGRNAVLHRKRPVRAVRLRRNLSERPVRVSGPRTAGRPLHRLQDGRRVGSRAHPAVEPHPVPHRHALPADEE